MDKYHSKALFNRSIMSFREIDELENNLAYSVPSICDVVQGSFWSHEKGMIMSSYIKILKKSIMENDKDYKYIHEIYEALKMIDKVDAGDSISLVLLAALLRYRILVDIVLNHNDSNDSHYYQKALDMYYDIGTLEGVISTYIDKTIAEYSYKKQKLSCKEMIELEKARKLSETIGSYKYRNILKYYECIYRKREFKARLCEWKEGFVCCAI